MMTKSTDWLTPERQLIGSTIISALTAFIAFREVELEEQTLITFIGFYIILGAMALMFIYRRKLINPKTRQMLQFSFVLLGFVLMIMGALGLFNGNMTMIAVFLLMLFSPGLAAMRAGMQFKKDEL